MEELLEEIERIGYPIVVKPLAGHKGQGVTTDIMNAEQAIAALQAIIISAEEGYAKPDSEIYQITIDRFNTSAENCVFVDDLIENVEAAQALGMHAIHHQNNDETIRKLDQVLKGKL